MKNILNDKEITPMGILIDYFASLYDLVYDSVIFVLKSITELALKIKKKGPLNFLINFLASLYDLTITFFASIYDIVYAFLFFLKEYVKWATDVRSYKPSNSQHKKKIQ